MSAKDISTSLTHQLSTILEHCRLIEPHLQVYLTVNDERPKINLELLRILSNPLCGRLEIKQTARTSRPAGQ